MQLSKEILEARKSCITGSDASVICGVNPWKNIVQLYLEKVGYNVPEDISEKNYIKAGHYLEPAIAKWFEDETGLLTIETPTMYVHRDYRWMAGNIDRRICGSNDILEIKTSRSAKGWGESGDSDNIPVQYLMQCAHYCAVLDAEACHIAVLIGGSDFRTYKYVRNKRLEENLIEQERVFWEEHVLKEIPPEPKTAAEVIALHKSITLSEPAIATSQIEKYVEKYEECREMRDKGIANMQIYKDEICAFMNQSDLLLDQWGNKLCSWKAIKGRSCFDRKRLKEELPEIEKRYTIEEEPSRQFRILTEKD
jgi:putative phage-type endonuclease